MTPACSAEARRASPWEFLERSPDARAASRRGVQALAVLFLCLAGAANAAEEPAPSGPAAGLDSMQVIWRHGGIAAALDIFPHPLLPHRTLLATAEGLLVSDDSGKSWMTLQQARPETAGVIRAVAFAPDRTETWHIAGDKGVWLTPDAGKTFEQVGSKALGMAADAVSGIWVYPGDSAHRTLLAAHGSASAGLSVSYDAGRTWHVVWPDMHVRQVVGGVAVGHDQSASKGLVVIGSKTSAPDVYSIYCCENLGDASTEEVRDIVPIEAAGAMVRSNDSTDVFVATADAGMCRMAVGWSVLAYKAGPADVSWASVGMTWGPAPDTQMLYAYDPRKLGLVFSTDAMKTIVSRSIGLPTGPFIKEGAHVRANAGGAVFYATINDALYVGTLAGPGIAVSEAQVTPPVLTFSRDAYLKAKEQLRQEISMLPGQIDASAAARRIRQSMKESTTAFADCRFAVTARVAGKGAGRGASVTVDLGPVGQSDQEPMLDDGRHSDGAPGDGVYGAVFQLNVNPDRGRYKRIRWPGQLGLTVTAVSGDGKVAGATAPLAVFQRAEDFVVWDEPHDPQQIGKWPAEGGATAEVVADDNPHSGKHSLRLTIESGPWSTRIFPPGPTGSIVPYEALTFWVRTDGSIKDELYVQLQDNPALTLSARTQRVPIVSGGYIKGGAFSDDWRQVVIPISRFLSDAGKFQPSLFGAIVFSGEGKSPGTCWIDTVRLVQSPDEPSTAKADIGRPRTRQRPR